MDASVFQGMPGNSKGYQGETIKFAIVVHADFIFVVVYQHFPMVVVPWRAWLYLGVRGCTLVVPDYKTLI